MLKGRTRIPPIDDELETLLSDYAKSPLFNDADNRAFRIPSQGFWKKTVGSGRSSSCTTRG